MIFHFLFLALLWLHLNIPFHLIVKSVHLQTLFRKDQQAIPQIFKFCLKQCQLPRSDTKTTARCFKTHRRIIQWQFPRTRAIRTTKGLRSRITIQATIIPKTLTPQKVPIQNRWCKTTSTLVQCLATFSLDQVWPCLAKDETMLAAKDQI